MRNGRFSELVVMVVMVVNAALLWGCTSGGSDVPLPQRACERLDECNALAAGRSVDECTEQVQHNLDGLAPGAQHDAEKQLGDCLEYETCSLFLDCAGVERPGDDPPPVTPPPTEPPPQAQTGQFAISWSIVRAGVPVSCAEIGAATAKLHSVLDGTDFVDIYDCSAMAGTTNPLPVGVYSVFMTIHDVDGGEMGRSTPQAATLRADEVVTLAGVDWQVSQP